MEGPARTGVTVAGGRGFAVSRALLWQEAAEGQALWPACSAPAAGLGQEQGTVGRRRQQDPSRQGQARSAVCARQSTGVAWPPCLPGWVHGSGAPRPSCDPEHVFWAWGQSLLPWLRLPAVPLGARALPAVPCGGHCRLCGGDGGTEAPTSPSEDAQPEPASCVLPFPPARAGLPRERLRQPGSHTLAPCLALAAAGGESSCPCEHPAHPPALC